MKTEFTNRDFEHIENRLHAEAFIEDREPGQPYTSRQARMRFAYECRRIVESFTASDNDKAIATCAIARVMALLDGKLEGAHHPQCIVTPVQSLEEQQELQENCHQYYADERELNPGDEQLHDAFREMMQAKVPQALL
jgi:hypothetical protein